MIRTISKADIPRYASSRPKNPYRDWCAEAIDEFMASGAEACELLNMPAPFKKIASPMGTELFHRKLNHEVRLSKRGNRAFLVRVR